MMRHTVAEGSFWVVGFLAAGALLSCSCGGDTRRENGTNSLAPDAGSDGPDGASAAGGTGGTGGAGDAGGARDAGGAGGGQPDAASCAPLSIGGPFGWTTSAAWSVLDYAGPAVVERSTREELVLYVEGVSTGSGSGGSPGTIVGARSIVSGNAVPLVTPGSTLWLFQQDLEKVWIPQAPPPTRGRRLSIRDREGGTLILGAVGDRLENAGTDPIAFGNAEPVCEVPGVQCLANARRIYYSVEAKSEPLVRAGIGEHRSVRLGGFEYDLLLSGASSVEGGTFNFQCADFTGYADGIWVDATLVPKDLASVTADVQGGGSLPACILGNDSVPWDDFGVYDVGIGTVYDGPITYLATQDGQHLFSLDRSSGSFHFRTSSDFATPAVGDTFWISTNLRSYVLRKSEGGDVIRAGAWSVSQTPPLDVNVSTDMATWLGFSISIEPNCLYEGNARLYDMVFGTSPPVRVPSGTKARLSMGGKNYDVAAMANGDTMHFSIRPASP